MVGACPRVESAMGHGTHSPVLRIYKKMYTKRRRI
jgi:hypothetical protein